MGRADSNRNVKNLVQSAKHLNKEISIHLYLVGHRREIIRLRWQSRGLGNINFHKLVSFNSIISTLSKFDMGFVALGHATTNISLALPNKFFEYIFAGLPVLVSQGSEMDRTLRQFPAGVAIDPSNPESIATALNALSAKRMDVLRAGVRDFQKTLSWREEEVKLLDIMEIHNL